MDQPLSLSTLRSESHAAMGDVDEDGFMDLIVASPDEAAFALHQGGFRSEFGQAETFFREVVLHFHDYWIGMVTKSLDLLFTHFGLYRLAKG